MLAAYARNVNPDDPFSALSVGEIERPDVPGDWTRVALGAASLNRHDLWSLAGVGLRAEQCPMILGTDAVGRTDSGEEVVVYPVIADAALEDETLDPKRTLLSEHHPGTLAEYVSVPARNLLPAPQGYTAAEAACLPTAYLTAWRMLTTRGRLPGTASKGAEDIATRGIASAGNTSEDHASDSSASADGGVVLVQGTGGGVATAAIVLAKALGARVYATGRSPERREKAAELGAVPIEAGGRLPERVDIVDRLGRRARHGALDQVPQARRAARHLRRHRRPRPADRPAARLLQAARDPRLDHGHPRRTRRTPSGSAPNTGSSPSSTRPTRSPTPNRPCGAWPPARPSGRSSSPVDRNPSS